MKTIVFACVILGILLVGLSLEFTQLAPQRHFAHTSSEYCAAILKAEGDGNYGIDMECDDHCKSVCIRTIEHDMKEHPTENGFEEFLALRYCPFNRKTWLHNVRWFLNNG